MRSKFIVGLLICAVAVCGFSLAAGAVNRTSFVLTEIGTADFNAAVPIREDDPTLAKLRSADYGRAILLSPEYFLGEMRELWKIFDIAIGGDVINYEVRIKFSDPIVARKENTDCYGVKTIKDEVSLVMNAVVIDKNGKIVFSSNFTRHTEMKEKENPYSELILLCFSDLASMLRTQFAATYRVNIFKPANDPEFDLSSVVIQIDGERVKAGTEIWLSKCMHELKVLADGCEDITSTINIFDHLQTSIKLKYK